MKMGRVSLLGATTLLRLIHADIGREGVFDERNIDNSLSLEHRPGSTPEPLGLLDDSLLQLDWDEFPDAWITQELSYLDGLQLP